MNAFQCVYETALRYECGEAVVAIFGPQDEQYRKTQPVSFHLRKVNSEPDI